MNKLKRKKKSTPCNMGNSQINHRHSLMFRSTPCNMGNSDLRPNDYDYGQSTPCNMGNSLKGTGVI